eukprot:jgi/Psemu1/48699/gm1.48699_g
MLSAGGGKAGIGNYTKAELKNMMFAAIRAVMVPCGTDDWDDVADLHTEKFPGRDATSSIRNKFNRLQRKKAPTGNPNTRWGIKEEAKELHRLIGSESHVTDGKDRYKVERNEFTPPPPPPVATQLVPLLLGQQTQPTHGRNHFYLVNQLNQHNPKMMNTIAQVLKLQQQALEQQQQ